MKLQFHPESKVLRQVCAEVTAKDHVKPILRGMAKIMQQNQGIGIAAPQVGIPKRIILVRRRIDQFQVMINPKIISASMTMSESAEGCLSLPGIIAKVSRHSSVKVSFLDGFLEQQEQEYFGIESQCVQHEIDHLNGIMMIDHQL